MNKCAHAIQHMNYHKIVRAVTILFNIAWRWWRRRERYGEPKLAAMTIHFFWIFLEMRRDRLAWMHSTVAACDGVLQPVCPYRRLWFLQSDQLQTWNMGSLVRESWCGWKMLESELIWVIPERPRPFSPVGSFGSGCQGFDFFHWLENTSTLFCNYINANSVILDISCSRNANCYLEFFAVLARCPAAVVLGSTVLTSGECFLVVDTSIFLFDGFMVMQRQSPWHSHDQSFWNRDARPK